MSFDTNVKIKNRAKDQSLKIRNIFLLLNFKRIAKMLLPQHKADVQELTTTQKLHSIQSKISTIMVISGNVWSKIKSKNLNNSFHHQLLVPDSFRLYRHISFETQKVKCRVCDKASAFTCYISSLPFTHLNIFGTQDKELALL